MIARTIAGTLVKGWVAGPEEVVTNAHVVAGESDTAVQLAGKAPTMPARVLVFDPTDDVAVLAVRGLQAAALGLLANPPTGLAGAIVGYPENGPLDAEAARIGRTQRVLTQDAYGRGPVARLLTPLRGRVRAGNSGGPVVDSTGRVLTTVFAGTVGGGPRGGYGVANSTVTAALGTAGGRARAGLAVSTQSCGTG